MKSLFLFLLLNVAFNYFSPSLTSLFSESKANRSHGKEMDFQETGNTFSLTIRLLIHVIGIQCTMYQPKQHAGKLRQLQVVPSLGLRSEKIQF